jgi:hypothetical protein
MKDPNNYRGSLPSRAPKSSPLSARTANRVTGAAGTRFAKRNDVGVRKVGFPELWRVIKIELTLAVSAARTYMGCMCSV